MRGKIKSLVILVALLIVIMFGTSDIPAKATTTDVTVKSDNSYLSSHVTVRVNVNMEKR